MSTPLVFAYCSEFNLQTTPQDLLFRVAVFERCILTLMEFSLSALTGPQSGLRKTFPSVVDLVSEWDLFPIPFPVSKFVDAAGFFQIIRQCSFEASLVFLTYQRLAEIDWRVVCCVEWFPYIGNTGDVLSIPERQVPGIKRDREGVLVTEIFS